MSKDVLLSAYRTAAVSAELSEVRQLCIAMLKQHSAGELMNGVNY
jgi:hypothetical protein